MAARPLSHRPGAQGEAAGLKNTLSSYLISKPAGSAGTAQRLLLLLSPSPRLAWGQLLCFSAQPGTLHCLLCYVWSSLTGLLELRIIYLYIYHYTAVLLLLLSPSPRLAWGQLLCCSAQPGTLHCLLYYVWSNLSGLLGLCIIYLYVSHFSWGS